MARPCTRRPHRIRPHMPRRASLRYADNARRGAVVGNPNLTAGTPVVVVRLEGHIQRLVVFVAIARSEEHTSELQSQSNLVCRLLLGKKNTARILYVSACS